MRTATGLVFSYERAGHPLSRSIDREDVIVLTSQLRNRLGMIEDELDFSPASLKKLENRLFALPQITDIHAINDDEIIQIVREIAAYVGEVLVLYAGGKWESIGTLWGTKIVFEGGMKITKEGRQRVVPSISFSLGNIGAAAFDMIVIGKKPNLYNDYLSGRKKIVNENLTDGK